LLVGLHYYIAFDRLLKNITDGTKVIYFAELHGWENALNMVLRERQEICSVGLQHTIVPLLYLTYFYDHRELQEKDLLKSLPKPNFLGCVGPITEKIFLESGWSEEELFIIGGFRFKSIAERLNRDVFAQKKKNRIVVALSIADFENEEVLRMLYDAFKDRKPKYKIIVKPHPCHNLYSLLEKMNIVLISDIFEISMKSLSDLVPGSSAMIVKESSSMFEALVEEIPVIVPQLYSIVDLCPLSGISDIPIYVKNSEELYQMIEDIFANKSVRKPQESGREFLKRYLDFPENTEQYIENLKKVTAKEEGLAH
ncbi:MAG: hypothetical protein KC618_05850, partial [Candidatus Omnitrophica bacterium]|nr:hypothetical protein [Candidatus Omnitrophota bacterium]